MELPEIATMNNSWYGDFQNQEYHRKLQTRTARAHIRVLIKEFNKEFPWCKTRVHVKSRASSPFKVEFYLYIDDINYSISFLRSRPEPSTMNYIMKCLYEKIENLHEDTVTLLKCLNYKERA